MDDLDDHDPLQGAPEDMDDGGTFLTQGDEQGVAYPEVEPEADEAEEPDEEHVSQSTRLHKKMREMKEMDEELAARKNEYAMKIKEFKRREEDFLEKQKQTIDHLRRFKSFIIETDTKRTRAEQKEQAERALIEKKSQEILALKKKLRQLRNTRDSLMMQHEKHKRNQLYLDEVVAMSQHKDTSDQYTVVDELVNRYKVLQQVNDDLKNDASIGSRKMETLQSDLQNLFKSKQNQILVQNSKLAGLLTELEEKTNSANAVENEIATVELRNKDASRKFGEVQMAIRNIHNRTTMSYPTTQKKPRRPIQSQAQQSGNGAKPAGSKKARAQGRARKASNSEDKQGTSEDRNQKVLGQLGNLLEEIGEKIEEIKSVVDLVQQSSMPVGGPVLGDRRRRKERSTENA